MTRAILLLILVFLKYFDLTISFGEEPRHYTVIPSPDDPCNETEQCLTLSQFANNSTEYLGINVMLHFVQGEHIIESTILIDNLNTFNMSSCDRNVTIVCNQSWTNFELSNMSVVHVSGLTFIGCTGNKFVNISQFVPEDSQFIGHKDINGTALELIETSATFVRTELSHNYGSRTTSLYCHSESDESNLSESDLDIVIFVVKKIENIEVIPTVGGAIVSTHSSVTIIESMFEGNSAQAGGAIFAELQSNITIINSTFVGNKATRLQSHQYNIVYCYFGGGVLYSDSDSSIVIHNSILVHNTAYWLGGVMATSHNDKVLETINYKGFTAYHHGGVLFNGNHSSITITDSEFANNSANYRGGVLDLFNADHSNITIANSKFTNNSADYDGGVLGLFYSYHLSVIITNSEFTGNRVQGDGGTMVALYIQNTKITISYSNFTNNSAIRGGIVTCREMYSSSMGILASRFVNNKACESGGVLNTWYTNVSVTQSTFLDNKASDGGTMHIKGGAVTVNYSQFHHNTANFGGVLWTRQANIISHNTSLSHNTAYTDGGVLFAQDSTAILIGANFSHNKADNNGGTMYNDKAVTSLFNCKFNHNTAGNDGGVMRSYQGTIDISESEYRSNSANNEGGVFHTDQTILTVNQTTFTDSKAKDGGVIWTDQGVLKINQCYFVENNASAGGVMWAEQATVNADRVKITSNYANVGVVYVLESNTDWSSILYSKNVGSLYAFGGAVTIRNNSILVQNIQPRYMHHLLKEGGTITAVQSEVKFEGSSLLSKGHAECGGALKAIESKIHIHGM